MNIWLVKYGEPVGFFDQNRSYRMSMLAEELIKNKNNKITYFTGTFEHNTKKQLYNKDTEVIATNNYTIKFFNQLSYKKNFSILRFLSIFQLSIKIFINMLKQEKPDLILASYPFSELTLVSLISSKIKGCRFIIDIRDLWPDATLTSLSKANKFLFYPFYYYYRILLSLILNNTQYVVSISDGFSKWAQNIKVKKFTSNKVIPIGYKSDINLDRLSKNKNFYLQRFPKLKNKIVISFIGVINRHYDFHTILKAAKKIEASNSNIIFYLCGDGEDLKKLKQFIQDNNINNVIFTGWINKDDINYILMNTTFGLAPYIDSFNFNNNITNKIFEYMSFGIPIISPAYGSLGEFIRKKKIGKIYEKNNSDNFLKIINELVKDKVKYSEIRNAGISLFKTEFSSSVVYKKYSDYIQIILKHK